MACLKWLGRWIIFTAVLVLPVYLTVAFAQVNMRRPIMASGAANLAVIARGSGTADPGATTLATGTMNCTGANLMVAVSASSADVTSSINDSSNTGYTLGGDAVSSTDHLKMGYFQNATVTSSMTVTATYASSSTFRRIIAWCVSGANTSAALDGSILTATGSTSPTTTAAITPSVSNGIILAGIANNDGSATWTGNNSFTIGFASPGDKQGIERVAGTGSITPSANMSAGNAWRMSAAAFK